MLLESYVRYRKVVQARHSFFSPLLDFLVFLRVFHTQTHTLLPAD
jgi:hypothetical protein